MQAMALNQLRYHINTIIWNLEGNLVAYFCQRHLLQYIGLIFFGYCDIDRYCLGMPKIFGIFRVENQGRR